MRFQRVSNTDSDLLALVRQLDAELKVTDGEDHAFYNQYNGLEDIQHLLLVYTENRATACGGFKALNKTTAEIKRMYTAAEARGKGIAKAVLQELEIWAKLEGFQQLVLETGKRQHAAIALYESTGFKRMEENYGPYKGLDESFCFTKAL
ncbi:GNAT family N-acetyltransferase [Gilvibacter sp.]|uniref:GNAT family N-acetyltransferase n=1 Tax=Gilvibacter sp. TaxID=2729997 RepID=UPI0025BE71B2|nr:GNAT family N-acetyltransferase [Gilvibacter sp.]NQX76680.1 GNAT family N-acetyltransferase [Gilvibacter sp.]